MMFELIFKGTNILTVEARNKKEAERGFYEVIDEVNECDELVEIKEYEE